MTRQVSTSSGSETRASKNPLSSDPDVLAQEIVEELEAALEQFREIAVDWGGEHVTPKDA